MMRHWHSINWREVLELRQLHQSYATLGARAFGESTPVELVRGLAVEEPLSGVDDDRQRRDAPGVACCTCNLSPTRLHFRVYRQLCSQRSQT